MAKIKIPLNGKVYQNIDEMELSNASPYLIDGWVDEAGFTRRRFGMADFLDLVSSSPVDGIYWDDNFAAMFAVSNGHIYKISDKEGTFADVGGDALTANTRANFNSNGTHLFACSGGRIVVYKNTGTAFFYPDTDAPDEVTHLGYLDGYLLANHIGNQYFYWSTTEPEVEDVVFTGSGLNDATSGGTFTALVLTQYRVEIDSTGAVDTFKWSNDNGATWEATTVTITGAEQTLESGVTITFVAVAGHTSTDRWDFNANPMQWDALDFASAESPDNIKALGVAWREVLLSGATSCENWYHQVDPSTAHQDFLRIEGAYIERGIGAPYSLKDIDNTWFFLDAERKLIRLDGRTPKIISTPIDKTLQAGSGIAGILADKMNMGGRALYILHLPDDNVTWVYDYKNDAWEQWGYWNQTTASHDRWLGNCVAYSPAWNMMLVGSRLDGKIYQMGTGYYDDAGAILRTVRRTAWIDHGTYTRKRCNYLTFKFKRGTGLVSGINPVVMLRWRNNGESQWGAEVRLDLGALGETDFFATLRPMGAYRSRQYEISITDAVDFIITDCEADIDILTS